MNALETALRIAKGTVFLLIGRGLAQLIAFFHRIIVARWLGPADFGILSLMTMLNGIFVTIFRFGIGGSLTRFVAQALARKENPGRVSSSAFVILFPLAVVASLLLFFLAEPLAVDIFHNAGAVVPFRIGAIAVFLTMLRQIFKLTISGFQRFEYNAFSEVLDRIFKLAGTVALLYLGYILMGAVWGVMLGILAGTIISWLCFRKLTRIRLTFASRKTSRALLSFSAPLYGADIVGTLRRQAPLFLLGYFLSTTEVGYYAIGVGIAEILVQFSGLLQGVMFPAYSGAHASQDTNILREMFNRSLKYTLYIFIPGAVGVFVLAEPVIEVLYGGEYLPGAVALRVVAFSTILLILEDMARSYLVAIGKPGLTLQFIIASTVVCVGLCIVLIPNYGIIGAAIALLVNRAIASAWGLFFVARNIKINLKFLPSSILATGLMALFLLFLPLDNVGIPGLVVLVVGGAVIYFIVLYLARGFDDADKRLFREFGTRILNRYGKRNTTG